VPGLEGKTLGRYEIANLLGAGGMGEVYRAKDTQLGRSVAIKVISGKVAQSRRTIERFEREAKTVAQLTHPNILAIHDFGSDDGVIYAVTELLDGTDLRHRMRGSFLPLSKAVEIGVAVANGLAAAHNKGIVHRDIKPENIFITSTGHVKILDFGIAGLKGEVEPGTGISAALTESLTGTGDVLGTVGYMSPEQVRGEHVDSRSDIFSLGCLLFEVLTGRRAFQGETSQDTAMAILNRDPDPIVTHRHDVPPGLEVIVRRCLEKQPDERFESARDVAFALQAISGARPPVPQPAPTPSILGVSRNRFAATAAAILILSAAVLWIGMKKWSTPPPLPEQIKLGIAPFVVDSEDEALGTFAEGLREKLAGDLAFIAQSDDAIGWIVPNAEAKQWEATTASKLGRYYGVTVAVEGEMGELGDRIRLDLTLVDPKTGHRLRNASIVDFPANVEEFQTGPVSRVVEMLGLQLTEEQLATLKSGGTTMTVAFDSHTRGLGTLTRSGDTESATSASRLAEIATQDDPLYGSAWLLMARCDLRSVELGSDPTRIESGLGSAARALELGARKGDVWRATGALHLAAGRIEDAIEALEQGVEISPADPELRLALADAFKQSGRLDEADTEIRQAIFLRPDYRVAYDRLASLYTSQGKWEAAAVEYQHAINCAPEYALGYVKLGGVNWYSGREDEAIDLFEKSIEIEPTRYALSNLASIHFNAYRYAEAAEMFEAAIDIDDESYVSWGNLAYAYQFGGEPEKAPDTFRHALELAEEAHRAEPDNHQHTILLAGYHAMLGQQQEGLEILEEVIQADPTYPLYFSLIAETFEDLGERERSLEWVERAFAAGEPQSRFEGRPTLRKLVADERYQALVDIHFGAS
jgi:serine/threonine protein kinase/tetratricopeptide (TPR) repeat protein